MGLTLKDFQSVSSREELLALINKKNIDISEVSKNIAYEEDLKNLQIELLKLQAWVNENKKRIMVIFEGRDAAGKGGAIRRFMQHLSPRKIRLVALNKPTEQEQGQWYFQRYIKQFPNPGEIVFFDRSWYNRAVVEPVMGFCTKAQYNNFMAQVSEFEHMIYEDGIVVIKFWLSISKQEQLARFKARLKNPLKRWKFSPVDKKGQQLWDKYTHYKKQMFSKTHTNYSPWIILKANDKKRARLESIRYVLSIFDYKGKSNEKIALALDPNVVMHYFRSQDHLD